MTADRAAYPDEDARLSRSYASRASLIAHAGSDESRGRAAGLERWAREAEL